VAHVPISIVPTARIDLMEHSEQGAWVEADVVVNGYGRDEARGMSDYRAECLRRSALWWVSSDMVKLLEHAAPSMPSQPLMPTDPPDAYGIVFFETTVAGTETVEGAAAERGPMKIAAMAWYPASYRDGEHVLGIDSYQYVDIGGHRDWVYTGGCSWPLGVGVDDTDGPIGDPDVHRSIAEDRRRLAAIWTLSQQDAVAERRNVAVPRADARRDMRANIEPSTLRVVRLRRVQGREDADDIGSSRDYSHRWIVSGHWRNQYLPSVDTHRLQWIAPYVKGPENKPLVVKETVKAWVR
jgi:hypothetical protein